ncbi:MAG: double zinc ribbon domain-containing protein [Methanobacterium sp.]
MDENSTKSCPYCKEEIPVQAVKCMHCGNWVEKENSEQSLSENKLEKEMTKFCPYCNSEVHYKALKCKYCGEWIEKKRDLKEFTEPAKNAIITETVREAIVLLKNFWR